MPRCKPGPFSLRVEPPGGGGVLDAHCHVWQLGRHGCTWPPPALAAIHRNYLPEDWLREATAAGVGAALVVQSQPDVRDTGWLLDLAKQYPWIAGVVGWVDLMAPDAPAQIAALATHPRLRGLRPMLQDLPDADWIAQPALRPAIAAMCAHDLCFDALVQPRHLPYLLGFAKRHPDLRIVVDHAGKPDLARGIRATWRRGIAELAALPNVFCKLSGLVTEAGGRRGEDALRPCVAHLLATFGPRRLLWGSDWPVLNLAGDYAGWLHLADVLTGLRGDERAALFGGNARRVYGIAD